VSASAKLTRDLVLVFFSVLLAVLLVTSGVVQQIIDLFQNSYIVISVLAGILFTSLFTSAIGVASFVVLGQDGYNPFLIAVLGGVGAVIGDTLIFRILKDNILEDIQYITQKYNKGRIRKLLRSKSIYWIMPFLAMIIIASPLPDELGIALLAASKIRMKYFFLISFILNFIGILFVVLIGEVI
jgi:uncharacterized membrane protein YdjX (TVP38/TMEM64 family)